MMDFLTFKSFISTEALIVFYYIGAVILPFGIWFLFTWLIRKVKLLNTAYENGKVIVWRLLNKQQQTRLLVMFITVFLFMELFWRMLFEFLIAYMQMRDALLQIQL
jgi:hypothetical protein